MKEFLIFFSVGIFIIISLVVSGVVIVMAGVGFLAFEENIEDSEVWFVYSFSITAFPFVVITNIIIISVLLSVFPKKKVEVKK